MAELKIATGKTLPAPPDAKKVRAFKIYRWNRMMAKPQSSARQPRCFLMLHPLEQVGDHQNPLAHTPRSHRGPSAAAPPPPVRCERNRPASSIPQKMVCVANSSTTSGSIGRRITPDADVTALPDRHPNWSHLR